MPRFREFAGWSEKHENVRLETKRVDGKELEFQRELTGDDYLFLQEDFVVTDSIFRDQNIIFDQVTDEWKKFCTEVLGFQVPADLLEASAIPKNESPSAVEAAEADVAKETAHA